MAPCQHSPVSDVLDDTVELTSRDNTSMRVGKSRPRWCLTTVRRQVHPGMILDDHRSPLHGTGRCLTAERRQAPLERVLGDALS
jgi:hypothetical protein